MTSIDVIDFYIKLENLGIEIWFDGGWGVDALLSEQTRPHVVLQECKSVPKLLKSGTATAVSVMGGQ